MSGTVIESGPLFSGALESALKQGIHEAQVAVAELGEREVRSRLRQVLRHPTGYYSSRVRTEVTAADPRVTDSRVIYGPWLEGTGSRNRTTRFKGYSTFRQVTQRLNGGMGQTVAARAISDRIGGM